MIVRASKLVQFQHYNEALPLLHKVIDQDPLNWDAWLLAGQCYRFLNDFDKAIQYISRASELNTEEPSIFLALGIAFQLNTQWDKAVEALLRAIEIDFDFALAYNSLALTQKKRGEFDKALHNYDLGLKALSRKIIKTMKNDRTNPIIKQRETRGSLWVEFAIDGAMFMVSDCEESIDGVAWPTGEQAFEEEQTERHEGLYWVDSQNHEKENIRMFLPNYFNTFCDRLGFDKSYSIIIGNIGSVLDLLERLDDAIKYFEELDAFSL